MTTGEIAALTRAKLRDGDPPDRRIRNIAPLDTAAQPISVFSTIAKYLDDLAATRAGACLVSPRFVASAPRGIAVLVTPEPYRAFVAVARALFPDALRPSRCSARTAAPARTCIRAARLEASVTIDPVAVIGAAPRSAPAP